MAAKILKNINYKMIKNKNLKRRFKEFKADALVLLTFDEGTEEIYIANIAFKQCSETALAHIRLLRSSF